MAKAKAKTGKNNITYDFDQPKTGIGIVFGLFLGFVGLIIGLCIYPSGSYARSSFVKAWTITFIIEMVLGILTYLIFFGALSTFIFAV